jgi:phosphohistidine phosphatase SixA
LSEQRRNVKRQCAQHESSMDGRTRFGDSPATRARVVAKRLETLTAQLGLGASRQPVPNGRAMRVALRVAGVEPPWFNSTVCSHCGWYGDLAWCCICNAALCSGHRLCAYKAGRCSQGRPQSATAVVCRKTDDCTKRSSQFADAVRLLDTRSSVPPIADSMRSYESHLNSLFVQTNGE